MLDVRDARAPVSALLAVLLLGLVSLVAAKPIDPIWVGGSLVALLICTASALVPSTSIATPPQGTARA